MKRDIISTCPCCDKVMDIEPMQVRGKLIKARFPNVVFTSGYRCDRHNKEVGGASNSSHLRGIALDIRCMTSVERFHVVKFLLFDLGAPRLFLYKSKNLIHVDFDLSLPYPRLGIL